MAFLKTQKEAARAYNAKAMEQYGEYACLNEISDDEDDDNNNLDDQDESTDDATE